MSPKSSRYYVGLLDVKPRFASPDLGLKRIMNLKKKNIFLWPFPLTRFLAETLRVKLNLP